MSGDTRETGARVTWLMGVLAILLSAAVIGWVSEVDKKLETVHLLSARLAVIEAQLGSIDKNVEKMQLDLQQVKDQRTHRWKR
jgi:hypothetical protein